MAWQQVLYFFVRLIHTVTVCWSAKLASVQLRTFRKVHWIWIAKLFLTYLVFLRKGLMAKKRRQGHLLLKPDPRSRQQLQMLKAFVLCIHNEIRGLVTPTTTPVENKVTTDINWITACIDRLICHCSGVSLRSSLCWASVWCGAFYSCVFFPEDLV